MRLIKSEMGFLFYEKILKQLMSRQTKLVVWQVSPYTGGRQVAHSHINSYNLETKNIFIELEGPALLDSEQPVFCYAPDGPIIFKTEISEVVNLVMNLKLPSEMKLLEDPDITFVKGAVGQAISDVWHVKSLDVGSADLGPDVMKVKSMAQRSLRDQELLNNEMGLSIDEEDKLFADKRESPRARPKDDKWVKVAKPEGGEGLIYKLFDLSRGGLGFISFDEMEFTKGSLIHVVGFNDFSLDDPLVGKVMSIRPMDGNVGEFKIGVKFSEGQD